MTQGNIRIEDVARVNAAIARLLEAIVQLAPSLQQTVESFNRAAKALRPPAGMPR